jgi:hypothetical protein
MTMSRPKYDTKSVSEDIQVLQNSLHRGIVEFDHSRTA